jgi:hypothetical protein
VEAGGKRTSEIWKGVTEPGKRGEGVIRDRKKSATARKGKKE